MLSRVAERVFWMARYLERAENAARILNTFSQMRMDLPRGSELPWHTVLEIFGDYWRLLETCSDLIPVLRSRGTRFHS